MKVLFILILIVLVSCKHKSTSTDGPVSVTAVTPNLISRDCSDTTTHQVSSDRGTTWGPCILNSQTCSVVLNNVKTIGSGNKSWNSTNSVWSECLANSCMTGYVLNNGYCVNFQKFLTRFLTFAITANKTVSTTHLTMKYDTALSGSNILGICTRSNGNQNLDITINKLYWESWDGQNRYSEMEQLLFHELGHCLLLRSHDTSTIPSDKPGVLLPLTIMNPYHIASLYYEGNYSHYISELFTVPDFLNSLLSNAPSAFPTSAYASVIGSGSSMMILKNSHSYVEPLDKIENFECIDE